MLHYVSEHDRCGWGFASVGLFEFELLCLGPEFLALGQVNTEGGCAVLSTTDEADKTRKRSGLVHWRSRLAEGH